MAANKSLPSLLDESNEPVEDLHHPEFPDACICGLYSGDSSMFSRDVLFNVATAYNEGEMRHRTHVHQSAMDGEILWNVYRKGKKLRFLEAHYYHIFHGPRPQRDNFYHQGHYSEIISLMLQEIQRLPSQILRCFQLVLLNLNCP